MIIIFQHLMFFYFSAFERQVLELPVLQIYLCVWCDECTDNGGSGSLGGLVYCAGILPSSHTALQG